MSRIDKTGNVDVSARARGVKAGKTAIKSAPNSPRAADTDKAAFKHKLLALLGEKAQDPSYLSKTVIEEIWYLQLQKPDMADSELIETIDKLVQLEHESSEYLSLAEKFAEQIYRQDDNT